MTKIINFFKRINVAYLLSSIVELYLAALILFNLYLIPQAPDFFSVGKYISTVILATALSLIIKFSNNE